MKPFPMPSRTYRPSRPVSSLSASLPRSALTSTPPIRRQVSFSSNISGIERIGTKPELQGTFTSTQQSLDREGSLGINYDSTKYVQWGIDLKFPLLMAVLLLGGIATAIGHHVHYRSLHGALAGSKTQQQWSAAFGTAYAFAVIALLRTACISAYEQYIWTLFRRKSMDLATIDNLFGLTSNPFGFFSIRVIKDGKVAVVVALLCWVLPLASLTPPGTLTVFPGLRNSTNQVSMSTINWDSSSMVIHNLDESNSPSRGLLTLARTSAANMGVIPASAPGPNTTFSIQFYGPSLQCSNANSNQQVFFNNFSDTVAQPWTDIAQDAVLNNVNFQFPWGTERTFKEKILNIGDPLNEAKIPSMLLSSIFAPFSWVSKPVIRQAANNTRQLTFANHTVALPDDFYNENLFNALCVQDFVDDSQHRAYVPQIWIQTTSESAVCVLGNASYDVTFEFIEGVQTQAQYDIKSFQQVPALDTFTFVNEAGNAIFPTLNISNQCPMPFNGFVTEPYMAIFDAVMDILGGNITMNLYEASGNLTGLEQIEVKSSDILETGLGSCTEFTDSYWHQNAIGGSAEGPVPWQKAANRALPRVNGHLVPTWKYNATGAPSNIVNIFNSTAHPAWMCRNKTLQNAIEDLMNNITISLLSHPDFITHNATTANVTYFATHNIYQYDAQYLFISYGIAALTTLFVVAIGFYSLHSNGVAHSTSFSALITTTRNPNLDKLSRGHTLGALPLDDDVAGVKMRFGELGTGNDHWGVEETHLGFGFAESTGVLKKGGKYV